VYEKKDCHCKSNLHRSGNPKPKNYNGGFNMKYLGNRKVTLGLVLCFFLSLPLLLSSSGFCQDDYVFVLKWGIAGSEDGQFDRPHGIAVDSSGNVYVADTWNARIQKFNSSGSFIAEWPNYGPCYGVAVDSSGDVYVVNTFQNMIWKFDSSGGFITRWGRPGTANGQFRNPYGVAVDSSGNVYVADTNNHRIQKFDSGGAFITKLGNSGYGDGQFRYPWDVAVDTSGNVYVVDTYNHRIQKFDSSGNFLTKWGSIGIEDGQLLWPRGLAVDSSGNVYVADTYNHRIQKFDSNGFFITKLGDPGLEDGQFSSPSGLTVDSSGNVYVDDTYNYRIQKFAPSTDIDIQTILSFFDECIENGTLMGSGPGKSWHRMKALRNMLRAAGELVEDGFMAEACQQLLDAYKRCDGQPKPPDFVEGYAAPQLAEMIQTYRAYLGCDQ
jgi:DNA-binding beta-propeller fold protein YncE